MSRISKYHSDILKFLKTKSFINDTSEKTKTILFELLETTEHIPAILCLTILNNQCKKYDIKIHGYYLASGVDVLMILAQVCSSRDYYDDKYGQIYIDNMIMEAVSAFYRCITQNIETLRLSKNGNINTKLTQLCIEYASKFIHLITQKNIYNSTTKMIKTDLFCFDINDKDYVMYKQKNKLTKNILTNDMSNRYGSVCKLALCLGWILGQGDDSCINKLKDLSDEPIIAKLEKLGDHVGRFLKLHDDFKYIGRDIKIGRFSLNYVINYGIKEGYIELTEAKAKFIEGAMMVGVETKTSKEIMTMIVRNVDIIMKDTSVDLDTQYDDVSTL